jgi:hypothetical protein
MNIKPGMREKIKTKKPRKQIKKHIIINIFSENNTTQHNTTQNKTKQNKTTVKSSIIIDKTNNKNNKKSRID